MLTWIPAVINAAVAITTSGVFYYSITRKLKKLEVSDKEIDIIKKQDDEWQELYREERAKRESVELECQLLRNKILDLTRGIGMKDLEVQKLKWYKCEINNCVKRRPPHVFDQDGNELENCN